MTAVQGNALIALPWPVPPLNSNQRMHWAQEAEITKQVRETACILAKAAHLPRDLHHVTTTLCYQPRDNRRRDAGNLMPTHKACLDGLVDYGLIPDDSTQFVTELMPVITAPIKGQPGRTWIELQWTTRKATP